ncbi:hypothetical protein BS47DRAFT_1348005 [Hydnum rufescens UP504]|uniref:Uncharacterized protein n=1 Tax=Hydnum rufescens UP504 TaxID=1448309 RepID=A0A9P6AR65_9AGAM|nr:hypothetical protein BS47DRAFT_1348005 [Hydnum rufescens UP504]
MQFAELSDSCLCAIRSKNPWDLTVGKMQVHTVVYNIDDEVLIPASLKNRHHTDPANLQAQEIEIRHPSHRTESHWLLLPPPLAMLRPRDKAETCRPEELLIYKRCRVIENIDWYQKPLEDTRVRLNRAIARSGHQQNVKRNGAMDLEGKPTHHIGVSR